jgi:acetoin utilization deacetylase AcuC-like enzyme
MTGLVYDARCSLHRAATDHVERPERTAAIWLALGAGGLAKRCTVIREPTGALDRHLLQVHTLEHLSGLADKTTLLRRRECERATRASQSTYRPIEWADEDTYVNADSESCARFACGGLLELCDRVVSGKLSNGFAVIRPPGHHAGANGQRGFCLYNNVAVVAEDLLRRHATTVRRVLIVDWDVHHGDGTQQLFYDRRDVLYFSIHRYDDGQFYPKTGHPWDVGGPQARGYNINLALNGPGFSDRHYIAAWHRLLLPVARQFRPDVILVSAGFDCAQHDPLGQLCVSPAAFAHLTRLLMDIPSSSETARAALEAQVVGLGRIDNPNYPFSNTPEVTLAIERFKREQREAKMKRAESIKYHSSIQASSQYLAGLKDPYKDGNSDNQKQAPQKRVHADKLAKKMMYREAAKKRLAIVASAATAVPSGHLDVNRAEEAGRQGQLGQTASAANAANASADSAVASITAAANSVEALTTISAMTKGLKTVAAKSTRLILALEGGYHLNSISEAACHCVSALLGDALPALPDPVQMGSPPQSTDREDDGSHSGSDSGSQAQRRDRELDDSLRSYVRSYARERELDESFEASLLDAIGRHAQYWPCLLSGTLPLPETKTASSPRLGLIQTEHYTPLSGDMETGLRVQRLNDQARSRRATSEREDSENRHRHETTTHVTETPKEACAGLRASKPRRTAAVREMRLAEDRLRRLRSAIGVGATAWYIVVRPAERSVNGWHGYEPPVRMPLSVHLEQRFEGCCLLRLPDSWSPEDPEQDDDPYIDVYDDESCEEVQRVQRLYKSAPTWKQRYAELVVRLAPMFPDQPVLHELKLQVDRQEMHDIWPFIDMRSRLLPEWIDQRPSYGLEVRRITNSLLLS